MLEHVRLGSRSGGDRSALRLFCAFSRLFRGAIAFLLSALPFQFCGALSLAFRGQLSPALGGQLSFSFGGQLALTLGGALPGLVRGMFSLLPHALLPGGAFLFPPGGALELRGMPITFRGAVAPQGVIRPCGAARRCAAVRRRVAIWRCPDPVGFGDRDRPGRGQARQRRRIVFCV